MTSEFGERRGCCITGKNCKKCLKGNLFVILLILGVLIGIGLGLGMRELEPSRRLNSRQMAYFKFPGEMLLRMLKMLILPLIITSMISGVAGLDTTTSGKMGLKTVVYYMLTTFIAVVIGIVLVVSIQPGGNQNTTNIDRQGKSKVVSPLDAFFDLIRNCFPDNIVEATIRKTVTDVQNIAAPFENMIESANTTVNTTAKPLITQKVKVTKVEGSNILGLIVFCIATGLALGKLEDRGRVAKDFFDGLNDAVMMIVRAIIWYTPIGIIFLIASKLIEMEDPLKVLSQLGMYAVTVASGLFIHGFIVLPLIFLVFVRTNPFKFMYGCLEALLCAVSTASSSATLPVTFRCIEERNQVDHHVSRFVLPIGATINMDGTALYEAVASIFIAQVNGIWLNIGQIITVSVTATAAAIGAAGVPEAGLVMMVIVLTAVGLPTEDVTLIISIDWFLDRLRTAVNVWGDCVGCAVVQSLSAADLERIRAAGGPDMESSYNCFSNNALSQEDIQELQRQKYEVPTDTTKL